MTPATDPTPTMTERELLQRLQDVLGSAEVDADDLVEEAWTDARDEVYATLKRLMTHDLLARALSSLGGSVSGTPVTDELGPGRTIESPTPSDEPTTTPVTPRDTTLSPDGGASMTYLFGIVAADTAMPGGELPTLPGGGELRFIDGPGSRALVSDVDPELFEVLREPSTDGMDLLAAAAHAHDGILARFAGGAVLPLGLGTALADDATIGALLTSHATLLQEELSRVRGHAEWAVTVQTFEPPGPEQPSDPTASGRDYLQHRRAELDAREDRWSRQDQLASSLHGPLAACAVAAERVESRPLEEASPPLLHGVYLLDDEAYARFESTIAYLRSEHPAAVIDVSGPWPPYHFVSLNLDADEVTDP